MAIGGKTKKSADGRRRLLQRVDDEIRRMSTQSAMFSEAVASRVGLNPTDLECLGIVQQRGCVTAGELSQATGLSTGTTTGIVDRLVRKGFVTREHDTQDRRRVLVRFDDANASAIVEIYAGVQRRMTRLWDGYSDAELDAVSRFMADSSDLSAEMTRELQPGGDRGAG